jgi:hypothetical protein
VCLGARVYRRLVGLAFAIIPLLIIFRSGTLWGFCVITGATSPALRPVAELIFGMPIEELVFFIVVPICGLLTYAAGAFAFGDVHHDRPAVRAGEFGSDGHTPGPAQPERHIHYQHLIITGIVVDDQVAECVRVEPRAVPGVEPIGDDVLGFTDPRAC